VRSAWIGALAIGAVGAGAHFGPGVVALGPLRMRLWPRLCGIGQKGSVALSFDDGPHPESTPKILKALDRLGLRATFFMLGSLVDAYASLAEEVAAAGHEVASHGYLHRSHLLRSAREVEADLRAAQEAIHLATGIAPRWHRPPYGALGGATIWGARRVGVDVVLWSVWGRDWRAEATPESIYADLERGLVGGATLLLHDTDATSAPGSWRATLGCLEALAAGLQARGLTTLTLSEHLGRAA
jgi:peptidoglycan/xylan/chitin deacetylase (PgdA/CDA1 family)